jgi:hypothetical protein
VRVTNAAPGGGVSAPSSFTVATDSLAPVTTLTGADDQWHNTSVVLGVTASDTQSGVQTTQYTVGAGAPAAVTGGTITVPADSAHQGENAVRAWSADWCGNTESPGASATVRIDVVGPKTKASVPSAVERHATVGFGYKAGDVTPKCDFVLKIRYKSSGKSARTYRMGYKATGDDHTYRIDPNLATGKYIYFVYATDQAGNPQSKLGQQEFKVK